MRGIVYRRFGGPRVLEQAELPEPCVNRDAVLIKVRAAGMNHVDLALRSGAGADCMETWFPVVPGWDVAGVVERVGSAVDQFQVGDEVIGFLRNDLLRVGSYVERVAARADRFVHKPASLDWCKAASLPLSGLTAWQAVVDCLRVERGETLMVHGGDGSVGSLALQLALRAGARVIASSPEFHRQFVESLGAEHVLPGKGLVPRVRTLAPSGVDAVLDCVGRGFLQASSLMCRSGARRNSIVEPVGEIRTVYQKLDLRPLSHLAELASRGELVIRISATYPLAFAASATRFLESGRAEGKVVLMLP